MSAPLPPEYETTEEEAAYTEWLRAKVAESLADPRRGCRMIRSSRGFLG